MVPTPSESAIERLERAVRAAPPEVEPEGTDPIVEQSIEAMGRELLEQFKQDFKGYLNAQGVETLLKDAARGLAEATVHRDAVMLNRLQVSVGAYLKSGHVRLHRVTKEQIHRRMHVITSYVFRVGGALLDKVIPGLGSLIEDAA